MKFAEEYKVVLMASALNWASAGTNSTDSINMENFHHATFLIDCGTMGAGNGTLFLYSGATTGAETTAETFNYSYGGATAIYGGYVANHDVLAAQTAAASLLVLQATYPNYLLVLEIDASDITDGQPWLTLDFKDDVGGNPTGLVSVMAILEPRYSKVSSLSALV